jgi:hypothetical protein
MFKRVINRKSFLSILLLCFFVSIANAKYSGGSGTESDPYLISTSQDVNELSITSEDWANSKCFLMTNDINLPTTVNFITPIGNSTNSFRGTFDGNGYAIRNLNLNGAQYQGLFGSIYHGNIKKLGLEDANIICQRDSGILAGMVVGYIMNYISECYSTGKIRGTADGSVCIGGLVGSYSGAMKNSYSIADVYAHGNFISSIGGLIGEGDLLSYCTRIENSYSIGNVSVDGNTVYCVGGLCGMMRASEIENCYTACKISVTGLNTGYIRSFIGNNNCSMTGYSFWNSDINPLFPDLGNSSKIVGITSSQMKQQETFINWDFINVWDIGENQTYPFLRKYNISDLNHDKAVNMFDFAIFAENWLSDN